MARARAELAALIAWWLHELRDIGEGIVLRVAPKFARRLVVQFDGAACCHWTPAGLQALDDVESVRGMRAVVVLRPQDVLRHDLALPAAVAVELDSAIDLQLERELPLPRASVLLDWKVVRRDAGRKLVFVRLIVVRRECIERIRDQAATLELRPVRIGAASATGAIEGNLLPRRIRPERLRLTSLDQRLLRGAALLALVTGLTVASQWVYERRNVDRELVRESVVARRVTTLTRQLEQDARPAHFLINLMRETDAVDVLSALTTRVPTDSWVYELDVGPQKEGALQVRFDGFVPTATMFVDMLEKTPEFERVRLVSASSAGLGSGKDRVRIAAAWSKK
ncbi:MAG: hypothetical protein ABI885_21005 [Gammaproteobacteria bacterium]